MLRITKLQQKLIDSRNFATASIQRLTDKIKIEQQIFACLARITDPTLGQLNQAEILLNSIRDKVEEIHNGKEYASVLNGLFLEKGVTGLRYPDIIK